jgi:opacity protein-like surface antigen
LPSAIWAQEDLLAILDEETEEVETKVEAIFKGTRLINGHTVETRDRNNLDFIISHRFGRLNGGAYEFFGLDQSNVRLGLDYGLTDNINLGIGRSSFEKTFDGYFKYAFVHQTSGKRNVPVSATLLSSISIKTLRQREFEELTFSQKIAYTHQVLIARKFSSAFSMQVMPTLVHFNAIEPTDERNNAFAAGIGGRIKLNKRVSLNAEYYYQFQRKDPLSKNVIAIGFDIETGGHVFQLQLTNAQAMIEKGFLAETTGDFFNGDIHFGFNISRTFQLK